MRDERAWEVVLPPDLVFFRGHFEGDPVLPAVAALQWLALRLAREAWPELATPRRLSGLKFRRALRPGEAVRVKLTRDGDVMDIALSVDGAPAVSGRVEFNPPQRDEACSAPAP